MTGASFMKVVIGLIFFIVIVVVMGIIMSVTDEKKQKDNSVKLAELFGGLKDFNASASVRGEKNEFMFAVDKERKKVAYITLLKQDVIPFSKILSVELQEDNNVVSSKSLTRTIGGAVVGKALAGNAGAIIGGLSGNSNQKKFVSKVCVKIKLKDIEKQAINIILLKASDINALSSKPIDTTDPMYAGYYKRAISRGNRIVDIISAIIDEEDNKYNDRKELNSQNISVTGAIDNLVKVASLKEKGLISDEEYNKLKDELLRKSEKNDNKDEEIVSSGPTLSNEVMTYIESGDKISAMNQYIEETGASLDEAMDIIESYM